MREVSKTRARVDYKNKLRMLRLLTRWRSSTKKASWAEGEVLVLKSRKSNLAAEQVRRLLERRMLEDRGTDEGNIEVF